MHLRLLTNFSLRHLRLPLRPAQQRFASQTPRLLDQPLFRSVRLLQIAFAILYRQGYRRDTVSNGRMAAQKGKQRFIAQIRARHQLRPPKSPPTKLTPHRVELHPDRFAGLTSKSRQRDNAAEHPFARETRDLVGALPRVRSFVAYSRPGPGDRLGDDYDTPGRLSLEVLRQLGVPREADFYLCGPPTFLRSFTQDLKGWGVESGRLHQEVFGPEESGNARNLQGCCPAAAPAGGTPRSRPDGLLRTERCRRAMESCIPEPAGICRGLQRSA